MKPLPFRTILSYSVANFGINMVNAFSNSALPLLLTTYPLPNAVIGFLAQERSFVGGFVQPVVGAISDRMRTPIGKRKPFFLIGAPLTAAALLFLSTHPPLWALLLILPFFAFFLAVANDPYIALMGDMVPSEQRGRVGATLAVFNMSGQVAMLFIANRFWEETEPMVFRLVAVGLIICFAVTFLTVREPPPDPARRPPRVQGPRAYVKSILGFPEVIKYAGAIACYYFGIGAATPFFTRFIVEVLGESASTAFLMFMLLVFCTALASPVAGIAGDRMGKKRVLRLGLAILALSIVFGSQVQTTVQAGVAMAFVGIANATVIALAVPFLTDLVPSERMGEFVGLGFFVGALTQPLGATLAGLMVDLTGAFRIVFVVTGVMVTASFLLLGTVRPERARAYLTGSLANLGNGGSASSPAEPPGSV